MTEEDRQYLTEEIARERNLITVTNRMIEHSCKKTLYKGLILLGRVSEVTKCDLIVSLPDRFTGYVRDVDVSQSYRRLLQETSKEIFQNEYHPLSDLFKPGDYVACYIKDTREIDLNHWTYLPVNLSMEPQLINLNVHPNKSCERFQNNLQCQKYSRRSWVYS